MRRLALLLLAGTLTVALAARAATTPPLRLKIAVNDVYGKATACECVHGIASREYGDFLAVLRTRYGIELEFVYFPEPYLLVKAMNAGGFDGALCKPWLLVRDEPAQFRRVADLQSPAGEAGLWGEVVVLAESPVRGLGGLAGKRIALGDADAYEKHHAAAALFAREHVVIPAAQQVERASCLESIDLLLKREVDAAVISSYALTADCAADVVKPGQLRTVGRTEVIPLTSLLLDTRKVSAADAARVGRAVIELSQRALPPSMGGGGFVAARPWNRSPAAESH